MQKLTKEYIDKFIKTYNKFPMPLQIVFAMIIGLILYHLIWSIIAVIIICPTVYALYYIFDNLDQIIECQTTITNINTPGFITVNYEVDTKIGRFYFNARDKSLYMSIKPLVNNGQVTITYTMQGSMRVVTSIIPYKQTNRNN